MKLEKSVIRLTCRKEKKALKNHPCKKTKRGRYIISVMESSYDNGSIGIGYYDGCEIFAHDRGYEHPNALFFKNLMEGKSPWRYNENAFPEETLSIDEIISTTCRTCV